jgi:peptidoglycan L-alanyl-D-glutamate endopeptidase CwlK
MPKFSARSTLQLSGCHQVLKRLLLLTIESSDFTVLCGHRGEEDQNKAYNLGNSKLKWPMSKHNWYPSMAVDIAPYPIDWKDEARFIALAGEVKRAWSAMTDAAKMNYDLSWGGDWISFRDLPHWELRPRPTSR